MHKCKCYWIKHNFSRLDRCKSRDFRHLCINRICYTYAVAVLHLQLGKTFSSTLPLFSKYFVCCFFHTFIHSYLQPYNLLKWLKKTCCVVLFLVVIPPLFFLSAGFSSFYFGCIRIRIRLQFSSSIFSKHIPGKEEARHCPSHSLQFF